MRIWFNAMGWQKMVRHVLLMWLVSSSVWAGPPPEGSPDWVLTHNDSKLIEDAYNQMHHHCCGDADGRPVNDYGIRFNVDKHHYEVRYNRLRWEAGTVSRTPREDEEGDIWLEVLPGELEFTYSPFKFTEVWINHWVNIDNGIPRWDQELLCISVNTGT